MIIIYMIVAAVGMVVGYTVAKGGNTVAQLTAPPSQKQQEKALEMKTRYNKTESIYEFLQNRFTVDFSGPGKESAGSKVINGELFDIKKQLVCVNFKLQAYNKHIEPKFCKELAKEFDAELIKINTRLENISKIWSDNY